MDNITHRISKPPGADPAMRKKRICLRCDTLFTSEGPHRRICPRCREFFEANPSPEHIHHIEGWRE